MLLSVSGFRCHPRPAIFSCTKQHILWIEISNWSLTFYFNVLYWLWTQFYLLLHFDIILISLQRIMNRKSRTLTENGLLPDLKVRWMVTRASYDERACKVTIVRKLRVSEKTVSIVRCKLKLVRYINNSEGKKNC